jgi:hypothetical protein
MRRRQFIMFVSAFAPLVRVKRKPCRKSQWLQRIPIDLIGCTLAASVRCAVGDRACHRLGEAAVAPVIHMQPVR